MSYLGLDGGLHSSFQFLLEVGGLKAAQRLFADILALVPNQHGTSNSIEFITFHPPEMCSCVCVGPGWSQVVLGSPGGLLLTVLVLVGVMVAIVVVVVFQSLGINAGIWRSGFARVVARARI